MRVNWKTSNEYNITSGIQQGSVLIPLVFLMFINDLPDYILGEEVFMFTDDIPIIISSTNLQELKRKINIVLSQFDRYCHKNRLI